MKFIGKLFSGVFNIIAALLCLAIIAYAAVFTVDFYCASNLQLPMIAQPSINVSEDGSGKYNGLGWTIEVDTRQDDETLETEITSVEFIMFDKTLTSSKEISSPLGAK